MTQDKAPVRGWILVGPLREPPSGHLYVTLDYETPEEVRKNCQHSAFFRGLDDRVYLHVRKDGVSQWYAVNGGKKEGGAA